MMGWHSASWSSGNEPRAGGLGLPIFTPVPGAPKVDIFVLCLEREVGEGCLVSRFGGLGVVWWWARCELRVVGGLLWEVAEDVDAI